MKLTGPAAAEMVGRERVNGLSGWKDLAACGWVRVERRVRPAMVLTWIPERCLEMFGQ